MRNYNSKPEILAPAGNLDCLIAAIRSGADAVYLGHQSFSARKNAANFDDEQLIYGVKLCKEQNKKVYLTLNTIIKDNEIKGCFDVLNCASKAGVNGIIVQDFAVARLIKEYFSHLEIHGSTQMSLSTVEDFLFVQNQGFSRAVVPREASFEEIKKISEQTDIELEVFVHGALCMCFSGQCYLSSIIGARSGNRGLCAQPCRLNFYFDENYSQNNMNVLSLKDLNLIDYIKELEKIGVSSFKIEGRMKRPEYVAVTSKAYKMALNGEKFDEDMLKAVFSRQGFTDGYLIGKINKTMFGTRQKDDTLDTENALKEAKQLYHKQNQSVELTGEFCVNLSAVKNGAYRCDFKVYNNDYSAVESQFIAQSAVLKSTTQEDCFTQLNKTGSTPFYFKELKISLPENLFIGKSFLNALRREALEKFSEQMTMVPERFIKQYNFDDLVNYKNNSKLKDMNIYKKGLSAEFLQFNQLNKKIIDSFDEIALPAYEIINNSNNNLIKENLGKISGILPFPFGNDNQALMVSLKQIGIKRIAANSLGEIYLAQNFGFEYTTRYTFNITNKISANEIAGFGAYGITLSFENEIKNIEVLGDYLNKINKVPKMIVYGYLPLMKFRNCPAKSFTACKECKNKGFTQLKDRTKRTFFVRCNGKPNSVSTLYNSNLLYLFDVAEKLPHNVVKEFIFTKESAKDVEKIIENFYNYAPTNEEFTRGLYLKGIK